MVPRRARIKKSQTCVSLNSRLESYEIEETKRARVDKTGAELTKQRRVYFDELFGLAWSISDTDYSISPFVLRCVGNNLGTVFFEGDGAE